MKRFVFEILARLGFWIPCKKYLPKPPRWDWVLISHVDHHGRGFRCIPSIAEYSPALDEWHSDNQAGDNYLQTDCVVTHWHKLPGERFTKRQARKDRESLTK